MRAKQQSAKFAIPLLLLALVNVSVAQDAPQSNSQQPGQSQQGGVSIDPSAGPLTPSEPSAAPLPNAPEATAEPRRQASRPPALPPAQPAKPEPVGTAAAEQIRTAGGGASRPAGNAIAPAKQHQYRSLLIKLGAVAAAGIAVGTVYGLSRATSSTPPHATVAAAK